MPVTRMPRDDEGMPNMTAESPAFGDHNEQPTIFETERLRVRPWTLGDDDLAAAFEIYSDPEVLRYMGGGAGDADLNQTRSRIERYRNAFNDQSGFGVWAIAVKATGKVVGTVELVPLDGGPEIEVGYHLAQ